MKYVVETVDVEYRSLVKVSFRDLGDALHELGKMVETTPELEVYVYRDDNELLTNDELAAVLDTERQARYRASRKVAAR